MRRFQARAKAYVNLLKAVVSNRLKWITRPSAAHLYITWRCNLTCQSCNIWKMSGKEELNEVELMRLPKRLRFLNIIKIVGGEPFLKEEIGDFILAIKEEVNPYILQVVTNGLLTEKIISAVERAAWPGLQIRVSLDGWEEAHDKSRGKAGSFVSALRSLKALSRLRRKGYRFDLGVNFSITKESVLDYRHIEKLCSDLDSDIIPGFPRSNFMLADSHLEDDFMDNYQDVGEEISCGNSGSQAYNKIERIWLKKTNRSIFHGVLNGRIRGKFQCSELKNLIYIFPNADVVICGLRQDLMGNLMRQPIEEIWFGEAIGASRRSVENCPGCNQLSIELLSRLYNGDLRALF